jgi:hypothetical protein
MLLKLNSHFPEYSSHSFAVVFQSDVGKIFKAVRFKNEILEILSVKKVNVFPIQ